MNHSIDQLIQRIDAMRDLAVKANRVRNQYSGQSRKDYDHDACKHLLEQIQDLARGIVNDKVGDTVPVEFDDMKKKVLDDALKDIKGTRMDDAYYYFRTDK
jgi:hypothetical protein|tara:strand:+ start:154 stop:456 length:303 start_codon:yes stop_codon:yes gene_type:complete